MRIQKDIRLITCLVLTLCLALAFFSALTYERSVSGSGCKICGAHRRLAVIEVCWIPIRRRTLIEDSRITRLRQQFIGPCEHDWTFDYRRSYRLGAKQLEEGSPSFDYPVNERTHRLASGLERFEDKDATILALEAVGDPQNHLRFLAAEAALSLDYMSPEEKQEFNWQSWWEAHREAFTICHAPDSARMIARKYARSDNGLVRWGAYESIEKLPQPEAREE